MPDRCLGYRLSSFQALCLTLCCIPLCISLHFCSHCKFRWRCLAVPALPAEAWLYVPLQNYGTVCSCLRPGLKHKLLWIQNAEQISLVAEPHNEGPNRGKKTHLGSSEKLQEAEGERGRLHHPRQEAQLRVGGATNVGDTPFPCRRERRHPASAANRVGRQGTLSYRGVRGAGHST